MKAKLSALIATFFIASSLFVVFAQTGDTSEVILKETVSETLLEEKTPCEKRVGEIDAKITQYKTDEPYHTATYQMLYLKTEATFRKAKVLGYDTTELERNLVELDILIKEFETGFKNFITKYEVIKRYVCSQNSDALYAQSFIDTKRALSGVRNTTSDILNLYQDEIRQNVLGLEMITNGQ